MEVFSPQLSLLLEIEPGHEARGSDDDDEAGDGHAHRHLVLVGAAVVVVRVVRPPAAQRIDVT